MNPHGILADLFRLDSANLSECRICPKLRIIHIYPSTFQKMNVSLAVQVNCD